jgi:uncharacterized membrane protein
VSETVIEWAQQLPPYLKYIVLTFVPWVELRGAVPLAVQQGEQLYIPLIFIVNWLIFFPVYFLAEWLYELFPEGSWLHRKLERIREKAHPKVEKYGVFGLALFVGIPLPGTGAYSGSLAAWLLDVEWHKAFIGVGLGVALALAIMWGGSELVAAGFRLF